MSTAAQKREKSKNGSKNLMAKKTSVSLGEAAVSGKVSQGTCSNCNLDVRCSRRQFSEQAWTVLLLWNEISPDAVDRPICSDCYVEMRDILIDRNDEIEEAMEQSEEVAKIRAHLGSLAS